MNELQSVSQIFQNKIFRIPDYQRGYAWRKEQLIDFWDDLMNLQIDRYHYTGLLSLKELNTEETKKWNEDKWLIDSGYKGYHIVDGQQRLTTISILLNEIICFINRLDENVEKNDEEIVIAYETLKEMKAKYIYKKQPPHNIITTYFFGYETDNPSFEYLRYKIFGQEFSKSIEETYYTKNLKYAKEFINKCLNDLYDIEGTSGIEDIYKKLTRNLMFNIHEIKDDYDVFVAFETMNNRGKQLTNLELLKNRLIYLTTIFDDNKLDENNKDALRGKINGAWKEIYYQLGKHKTTSLSDDEFLRAHWIMFYNYSRKKGDDYIKFLLNIFSTKNVYEKQTIPILEETFEEHEEIESEDETITINDNNQINKLEPTDIDKYVLSLNEVAKYWYYSFFPSESDFSEEEKQWLDKLNRIGIGYFRPLVTVALTQSPKTTEYQRTELFKQIERFIFMFFRMGTFQSSFKSSDYYRKTRELYNGTITIEDIIDDLRMTIYNDQNTVVGYFMTKIDKKFNNGEGFYSWKDLKYFLYEYEYSLSIKNKLTKINWEMFSKAENDKLSIEHILPKTATKWYWKNQFRKYTDEEVIILSNSLGNLLPLAQSINSSLQNDSFGDKKTSSSTGRRGYENGSHSEIEVSKELAWNVENIYARGIRLLSFMEERWGFKFYEEGQKSNLLHIDFIFDQRDEVDEIEFFEDVKKHKIDKPIRVKKEKIKKTDDEQIRIAYKIAKQVYEKSLDKAHGIELIIDSCNINEDYANMYIDGFAEMINGLEYNGVIDYKSAKYFLSKIKLDYGEEIYKKISSSYITNNMSIHDKLRDVFFECEVGEIFSRNEIIDMVSNMYMVNRSSIIPSDYCYNRTNKGIGIYKNDNLKLFEWLEEGKYKYLGENYNYKGEIISKPKSIKK